LPLLASPAEFLLSGPPLLAGPEGQRSFDGPALIALNSVTG